MLELRHAKLELFEIVPLHEAELVDERAQRADRLLRQLVLAVPRTGRQLGEELLDRVEE